MDNSLQHLRSVRAEDLPPTQQTCTLCKTPWGNPRNANGPPEHPIILTCGCIAGSLCLAQSFQKNPRCPLCHTTIRIIASMKALRNQHQHQRTRNRNHDYLQQLEIQAGLANWPIPSIETRSPPVESRGGSTCSYSETKQQMTHHDLRNKLGVLNAHHDIRLSVLEFEICVSLVDYRLRTSTLPLDVLDEFFDSPLLCDAPWWKRCASNNPYGVGELKMLSSSSSSSSQHHDDNAEEEEEEEEVEEKSEFNNLVPGADADDVKAVLRMINIRAGTSFLLTELAVVLSLMNHLHGRALGLLDVLGLRDGGY